MMNFKNYILLVLLLIGVTFNTLEAQVTYNQTSVNNERTINHTVKMGETVYSIANAYKTTDTEINRLNPGSDRGIRAGQILRIPNVVDNVQENLSTTSTYIQPYLFKHIIVSKETLFSVSQKYNITVAELKKANPDLNESNFPVGKEIIIPDVYAERRNQNATIVSEPTEMPKTQHKVERQETLYSISRKYDCSVDELRQANPSLKGMESLQEGFIINIPCKSDKHLTRVDLNTNQASYFLPQDGVARIALLLPFIEGSKTVSQERITEYYEGFLLAVQRMKEKGLNAEIYTFDIGTDNDTRRLESILGTNELNSLNLIIGGISDKQVQLISKFSQNTGVKYVVPFSNKNTGVNHNKYMFQVANSHSSLFPKIVGGFITQFANSNIIFLSEAGSDNNKNDFVKELQKGLQRSNISYRTAPSGASIIDNLNAVADRSRQNIIVPTSSSEASLKRIMDAMPIITKNTPNISLFGYPEWQAYVNKTRKLHTYNSYIYSMFYLDTAHPEAQLFADKYKKWYNKNFLATLPRYAHMGYDTGLVFLSALQKLGHDFSQGINYLNVPTLQSALDFEPANVRGGYINTGVYFINMRPDGSIVKTQIGNRQ